MGYLKHHHHVNSKKRAKKAKIAELKVHMDEASTNGDYDRFGELAQQMKKIQQQHVGVASPLRTNYQLGTPSPTGANPHPDDASSTRDESPQSTPGVPPTHPEGTNDGKPPMNRGRRGRMAMLPGHKKANGSNAKHPGGEGGGKRLSRKAAELKLSYQVSDCRQILSELESEATTFSREKDRLKRMLDMPEQTSDYDRKHLRDQMMHRKQVVIPSLASRLKSGRSELGNFLKEYKSVLAGCFDVKGAKQIVKDVKVKIRKLVETNVLERPRPGSANTPVKGSVPHSVPPRRLVSEPSNFRASVDKSLLDEIREKEKSVRAPIMEQPTTDTRNLKRNAVNTARLDPLAP